MIGRVFGIIFPSDNLHRVTELLDYTPEELTGKNIYNLCHGEDAEKLRRSHLDREYYFRPNQYTHKSNPRI